MANAMSPAYFPAGYYPPTVTAANARGIFAVGRNYTGNETENASASNTSIEAISETIMFAGGAVQMMAQANVGRTGTADR